MLLNLPNTLLDALYDSVSVHKPGQPLSKYWLSMARAVHVQFDLALFDEFIVNHAQQFRKEIYFWLG